MPARGFPQRLPPAHDDGCRDRGATATAGGAANTGSATIGAAATTCGTTEAGLHDASRDCTASANAVHARRGCPAGDSQRRKTASLIPALAAAAVRDRPARRAPRTAEVIRVSRSRVGRPRSHVSSAASCAIWTATGSTGRLDETTA